MTTSGAASPMPLLPLMAQETSSEKNAALNFGLEKLLSPTERYDIADELMFSIDMETGFPRVALISAAWGLGETVVQGRVVRTA